MHDLEAVRNDLISARATLEMMNAKHEDIIEFIDSRFDEVHKKIQDFKLTIQAYRLDLSDETTIGGESRIIAHIVMPREGGIKWRELKKFVMRPDYPMEYLHVSKG